MDYHCPWWGCGTLISSFRCPSGRCLCRSGVVSWAVFSFLTLLIKSTCHTYQPPQWSYPYSSRSVWSPPAVAFHFQSSHNSWKQTSLSTSWSLQSSSLNQESLRIKSLSSSWSCCTLVLIQGSFIHCSSCCACKFLSGGLVFSVRVRSWRTCTSPFRSWLIFTLSFIFFIPSFSSFSVGTCCCTGLSWAILVSWPGSCSCKCTCPCFSSIGRCFSPTPQALSSSRC